MQSQEVITTGLPGKAESCWTATAPKTSYPALPGPRTAEVVVVGAGIVGITAARSLTEAGLSVALLEARRIGRQVTGRSTAKVTTRPARQSAAALFDRRCAAISKPGTIQSGAICDRTGESD